MRSSNLFVTKFCNASGRERQPHARHLTICLPCLLKQNLNTCRSNKDSSKAPSRYFAWRTPHHNSVVAMATLKLEEHITDHPSTTLMIGVHTFLQHAALAANACRSSKLLIATLYIYICIYIIPSTTKNYYWVFQNRPQNQGLKSSCPIIPETF